LELAKKVADLQFRNREYVLLFRGQNKDYLSGKNLTLLRPSIFRANGEFTESLEVWDKTVDLGFREGVTGILTLVVTCNMAMQATRGTAVFVILQPRFPRVPDLH